MLMDQSDVFTKWPSISTDYWLMRGVVSETCLPQPELPCSESYSVAMSDEFWYLLVDCYRPLRKMIPGVPFLVFPELSMFTTSSELNLLLNLELVNTSFLNLLIRCIQLWTVAGMTCNYKFTCWDDVFQISVFTDLSADCRGNTVPGRRIRTPAYPICFGILDIGIWFY